MMNDLNSRELMETLRRAKAGDVEAIETVMISHKPLVRERIAHLYILGADYEDTLQEGMIGLYKAILTYDPARGASFATYASTCVRNHVIDQVKKAGREKDSPLNLSLSLQNFNGDQETAERSGELEIADDEADVLERLIAQELTGDLSFFIQQNLSTFERKVLTYYLRHFSNQEIALRLAVSSKSVENALYRARQKIRTYWMDTLEDR
jgi:RNA polymerase sporulation-specific sigma factor